MKKIISVCRILLIVILLLAVVGVIVKLTSSKKPSDNTSYYTVSFDVAEYGKALENVRVKEGEIPPLPVPECKYVSDGVSLETGEVVSLADYEFVGWYLGDEPITEENVYAFDKDVTLTAKWRSLFTPNY